MTGNTTSAEKLRSLFLAALMVFSVFAGTIALSGSAAAVSGNIALEDANPSSAVNGETVNNQNLTFSADFAPADGNTDTVRILLDDSDFQTGSLSPNSANANTTSISSSIQLVDGPDNDGVDDTLKFSLSDAGGPTNFSADFGISYADGTSSLSGEVYVTDSNGPDVNASFPTLVSLGGGGSNSGFAAPLPTGLTDNTPSSLTSPGATQLITNLSFGTAGNVTNVTVNATGGANGNVGAAAISDIRVELDNASGDTFVNTTSYDSHNTTVEFNVTNGSAIDVTDLRVYADIVTAGGQIDAGVKVTDNGTVGNVDTLGVQTITSKAGFISGRVSDQANNDVQNATVVVRNSTRGFVKNTTTDSQGDYTIEVPPGSYTVTADKTGFASAPPKDKVVETNSTTTANLVIRRIIFPDTISVTPTSDTTFVDETLTYTVTVRDQNGDLLDGIEVGATVTNNPDITFVSASNKTTGANGTTTFTVTSSEIASGTLLFEAINGSGPNPTVTAGATFTPRSGNGTVFGNVFEVGNDADHGLVNATVYAVNKNRFVRNSISAPTPNNASETRFYRVINEDTGAIVDYDDYRVDNNGQNAQYTWAVIREHNATNESFGSGFAVRTKVNNSGPVFVTPLEAGNYTIQSADNQRNASDARFADRFSPSDNFTDIANATNVTVFENLTVNNAEALSSLSGAKLVDITDPDGKYLLDYLFADGQEGVDYTLIAQKAGYERDYVDATVAADGAFFEPGEDENFDLRPRDIEAGQVNITQIGLHPNSSYNVSKIDEFANKSDEFAQLVPRNGSVIDVVEVETLLDNGARINGTTEVSVDAASAFGGRWLNASAGGTVVDYAPSVDRITVNTGSDGVARLFLLADSSPSDLLTNKTAVLTNDRSASDNSTVRFVGQINFKGAAISGIVTDTNDDPVQDSIVYTENFLFPTEASVVTGPNSTFNAPADQTRFTVEPTSGIAAAAVDDASDTFEVTRQRWNSTGGFWEGVTTATVTRSELENYDFPRSDFPGVSVDIASSDGFKLVDIVELTGGTDPDASYTLDPVPAVETDTSAASTEYEVRAIKLEDPNASATRFGQAAVQPGSTDDANIVLPINVTSSNLQVTSLSAPSSATVGSTINVQASITNTGGALGQLQTVEFRLDTDGDGSIDDEAGVANTTVDVDPGDTETVTFSVPTAGLAPGTYTHGVATGDDTRTATIDLTESSDFQVSSLSAPANATQGDTVSVSATVTNNGASTATQTVEFRANGSVVDSTSLTLGAGASDTVSFSLDTSGLAPGTYTHGVFTADDNETATIEILAPAVFDITDTDVPANVTTGDTLRVSAEITNTGDATAEKSVSFELNGTNVTAGGTSKVDIVFAFDDTGSMGGEISGLQENVVNFTNAVEASGADARYSLVSFGDTTEVDQDYTDNVSELQTAVNDLTALGGGSFPENGYGAISDGLNLSSRSDAAVVVIHITDASTHYEGDGSFESFSPVINSSDLADRINSEGVSVINVSPRSPTSDARANSTRWALEEVDDGEWIDLESDDFGDLLEGRIADLVSSKASGTGLTLMGGESATVTFNVSTDRLAPGTYDAIFSTPDDEATSTVEVEDGDGGGTTCPDLSSFVASYDADNDCGISLTELGQASADFANGDITLTELGQVSTAFANTADT